MLRRDCGEFLWGFSFKVLVVGSEMESNAERIGSGEVFRPKAAKLAALSKIAQCVGPLAIS